MSVKQLPLFVIVALVALLPTHFIFADVSQLDKTTGVTYGFGTGQASSTPIHGESGTMTGITISISGTQAREVVTVACYTTNTVFTYGGQDCGDYVFLQEAVGGAHGSDAATGQWFMGTGSQAEYTALVAYESGGGANGGFSTTLNPAYYYVVWFSNVQYYGGTHNLTLYGDNSSPTKRPYMILYDSGALPLTTTRIVSVVPPHGTTIATSTTATIGGSIYINEDDYEDGMVFEIKYAPYSAFQASVASPDALYRTITFPITHATSTSFSTSSPVIVGGLYTMQSTIRRHSTLSDVLNFFGFGQFAGSNVLTASSTQFTANALTSYDVYVASTTAQISNYLASSTVSMASCTSFVQFALVDCLNLLFVPQYVYIQEALRNFKEGFLSYAPWGYVTRFVSIMNSNATTTPPSLDVVVPPNMPGGGQEINLTPWGHLMGDGSILSTATSSDGTTFREATETYWNWFVLAMFAFAVVHHILGMRGEQDMKNV